MAYHTSIYLFLFLPFSLLAYQLTPQNKRWLTLTLSNYFFFWMISGKLVVYLIGTTIFTHYIGNFLTLLRMQREIAVSESKREESILIKKEYKSKERKVLAGGIATLLIVLVCLKYSLFFTANANRFFAWIGFDLTVKEHTFLVPIGISFYTLQAIGYMADVYWGKIKAYPHLGKLALFLGFFPQIMEGPISMYNQTADCLWEGKPIKQENLSSGSVRILWGLFKKMIIADRLYLLVYEIFENYEKYQGIMIIIAAIAYTIQLYMEFSGCIDIIIGSGKMFGITLPENFRHPFMSGNAAEFWRRWHITLGTWFKTYIFYPVSVSSVVKRWSRFGKKHLGKHGVRVGVSAIVFFPVWLCNGLWHGPRWSYIFYGMYYFVILLMGIIIEPVRNRIIRFLHLNEQTWYFKTIQILKTWIIIFIGELFFRANSLHEGIKMFQSIFENTDIKKMWDGTLFTFGLDQADYLAIITGCLVVALVEITNEKFLPNKDSLKKLSLPVRWSIYYALIISILIFGAYGIGYQQVDMIYAGF